MLYDGGRIQNPVLRGQLKWHWHCILLARFRYVLFANYITLSTCFTICRIFQWFSRVNCHSEVQTLIWHNGFYEIWKVTIKNKTIWKTRWTGVLIRESKILFLFFSEKTFCKSSHGRYVCKFCTAGALCEHMGPLIMKYWLWIETMKQVPWHMGLFCWSEVLSRITQSRVNIHRLLSFCEQVSPHPIHISSGLWIINQKS